MYFMVQNAIERLIMVNDIAAQLVPEVTGPASKFQLFTLMLYC